MALPPASRDLTRLVLGVLVIAGLLAGVFVVLHPFLPALLWATMIVVATWPLLRALERRLGGRRGLATVVMLLAMIVVVFVPLAIAAATILGQAAQLPKLSAADLALPAPPAWVASIPLAGARIAAEWQAYAALPPEALAAKAAPYLAPVAQWIAGEVGRLGAFVLHLAVTLVLCGVLYATGEPAARGVRRFARRLHGDAGESAVLLAAASVRAVALGIVVTAFVQTLLAALGLAVAGVPFVAVLAAVTFVLCIAQIGPLIPLLASAAWLWFTGAHLAAVLLGAWSVVVAMLDNVLRPMLIRRGADLPLLLIMAGVIGGLLSMGLVGLFAGPVLLAVAYRLVGAWVAEQDAPAPAAPDRRSAASQPPPPA